MADQGEMAAYLFTVFNVQDPALLVQIINNGFSSLTDIANNFDDISIIPTLK